MKQERRRELNEAMVRFADGERDAFQAVFHGLWPILSAFTRGAGLDEAEADDAAQRALVRVFAQIADFDPSRDAVAWAVTIAAYEVLTSRKRQGRRREHSGPELADVADGLPGPEAQAIAGDLIRSVHVVIGDLDERDRTALSEVLDDHGITSGETARKRRFRAIERLKAAWRKAYG